MIVKGVAEAAVVPVADDLKGKVPDVYVSLQPDTIGTKDIEKVVVQAIETEIGKIARPKNVWVVPDMPKTRSGKIMRRVLASISNNTDVGDITTLANPEVVEYIRNMIHG
jgi:acetyl-CoA synthetase